MLTVLVGAPGSGKSTVADLLRDRGLRTVDTDDAVAAALGRSVWSIFVELGEDVFRQAEEQAALAALTSDVDVVALGGGALESAAVAAATAGHDVVWLDVDVTAAAHRSGLDVARPAQLGNVRGMFMRMLKERAPQYEAVATRRVDTSGLTPDEVAAAVLAGRAEA